MPDQTLSAVLGVAYVGAALVGAAVGIGLFRSRPTTTSRAFGVALVTSAVWSLAVLVAMDATGPARTQIYAVVVVPAIGVIVAAFVCGMRAVARVDWRPRRRTLVLLAVHPAAMLLVGLTNQHHGLLVSTEPGSRDLVFGPLFWVHSVYAYGLLVGAGLVAFRARRHLPALRSRQLTAVVTVGLLPGAAIAVQLAFLPPDAPDITPLSFVVVGLVDAQLIFRGRALAALPVARSTVLETIGDGILVVDDEGLVVDANAAALRLLRLLHPGGTGAAAPRSDGVVGQPAATVLRPLGADADPSAAAPVPAGRRHVDLPAGHAVVDVRTAPIVDTFGRVSGTVVVVRDVTVDTAREEALTRANAELREHVDTIERLRAEVSEQAIRDAVTGLHNRRYLDDVLRGYLVTPETPVPVALAILDADHFKAVNDRHGHVAGDRMLSALADALTEGAVPGDTLVRYGGEEFVVVMPGADVATATARVEDLRARCAAARAATRDGPVGVTVSAGIALSGPGATPSGLLDAADRALYAAKDAGRDRLVVADAVVTGGNEASSPLPVPDPA